MDSEDTDPSDNGTPPERATIELALKVALHRAVLIAPTSSIRPSYWLGAAEALRWGLGERTTTPVSGRLLAANLTASRGTVRQEAAYAYEAMQGQHREITGQIDPSYLTGAENTLCWLYSGHGFAESLDPHWLRKEYRITTG